ncbi:MULTISPECIES: hypothetical protein [Corallococcus]|uniref:hypothetical protein n=1 Tax=Corallococcus TaxID=83461 RepID=UPI0011804EC5|nr:MULTISPECIES: hypothetical protein [Corallococcus]NBD11113.1 hypothetical protein [Corallococcus silvisoli]TSC26682.1 hypothetical protein FOF48_21670 [Corallococcus sp. Z5C101001]
MAAHAERLDLSLTLTLGGTAHVIAPADILAFELDLHGWGHEGRVEFRVLDETAHGGQKQDKVLADFLKPDLVEVALELKAVHSDTATKPTFTSLKVKGLGLDKALSEETVAQAKGAGITYRHYTVRFVDPARLLWTQHYPCVLYTQKTLQDVLDAHKGDKISLANDWDAKLGATLPLIFLGLSPESGASFYDFVVWFVHTQNGVLAYDYTAQGYQLRAAKDATGTPLPLRAEDVDRVTVVFPEVARHDVAILNAAAESPKNQAITNAQAVTGVRQDVLLRTDIADDVQSRVTLETARLKVRGLEVELDWNRFPPVAFAPGALVKLPSTSGWMAAGVPSTDTFRVRRMSLRAEPLPPDDPAGEGDEGARRPSPDSRYLFSFTTRLEKKDEPHVDLPPFTAPVYPRFVEGLVVSEVGEQKDETWQAYTDDATSLDSYKVKLPLFANQIVQVPFNANLLPGHFYFPAYKGARVLVALDFLRAWLKRHLDWRAGARLPSDGQGVHLLVGKTTTNGTSMRHFYDDNKPLFRLMRTNASDTEKIELKEGSLLILVKEESA